MMGVTLEHLHEIGNALCVEPEELIYQQRAAILERIDLLHSLKYAANELYTKLLCINDELLEEMLDDECAAEIIQLRKALDRLSQPQLYRLEVNSG